MGWAIRGPCLGRRKRFGSDNVQTGCGVNTVGSGEAVAGKYLTEREADHSASCIGFVKN